MRAVRFDLSTQASPEQVLAAFTDFTDRRPRIWERTLDPSTYEVRELGDTWAVARESTPGSPFWVVCRYDWSDPAVVRWTVDEGSWGGHGSGYVRIEPTGDGGSRLHADWSHTGVTRLRDRAMLLVIDHAMNRVAARMWRRALDRFAVTEAA